MSEYGCHQNYSLNADWISESGVSSYYRVCVCVCVCARARAVEAENMAETLWDYWITTTRIVADFTWEG